MIIYRRAKSEDLKFIYRVRKLTLKKMVDQIWGWDQEWQKKNILDRNNLKRTLIIIQFGRQVGYISVFNRRRSISLERIEILPKFQGKGIGKDIIKRLIKLAIRMEKPFYLQVLKINKRAQKFYYRLGFTIIGENETHFKFEYDQREN